MADDKRNWSRWYGHDSDGQPVPPDVPVQVKMPHGTIRGVDRAERWPWATLVGSYRYDLDHPDAPANPYAHEASNGAYL